MTLNSRFVPELHVWVFENTEYLMLATENHFRNSPNAYTMDRYTTNTKGTDWIFEILK